MTSLSTIVRQRRTIREFDGRPVAERAILDILEAAVWAPFHSRKEPWRFILFAGEARKHFASAVLSTLSQEAVEKHGRKITAQYVEEIPVHLIVVMSDGSEQKRAEGRRQWEDAFGATSALIQNIQLLAWEQRIGVVWKTNPYNGDRRFCEAIGVREDEKVVGTLHLGYFDERSTPEISPRTPVAELLTVYREN